MSMLHWFLIAGIAALFTASLAAQPASPDDPYLWLEEVMGEKPLAWVRERNAASTALLTKIEGFTALNDRLLRIMDSDDRIPFVSKEGEFYYNFWRDARNKRGLWRRTTHDEYRKPKPAWEIVLDLDALAASEKENWVWRGAQFLPHAYERCLISLSRGGADATVIREFDMTSKSFVDKGFTLPEAKTRATWRDLDTLLVATDFGKGSLTDSGYPRQIKEWRRGTPLSDAKLIFEGNAGDVRVDGFRDHSKGFERDFVSRGLTFWTREVYLRQGDKLTRIEAPVDAVVRTFRDLLFIELRSAWTVSNRTYPAGALLVTNFNDFLAGKRDLDMLFEPTERKSLASFSPTLNYVVVNELDNVSNHLFLHARKDGKWVRSPLGGQGRPKFSTINVSAIDGDESDDYFQTVSGYLTPLTLSHGTLGQGAATPIKEAPAKFDAEGLKVTQHEATSKDGTRVPYFQIARADLALNSKNPTLLYGYGGFEIPLLPGYNSNAGAAWLEKGGVYIVANIRGGGEFGPQWHQAALKSNRNKAYEDFIAIAQDLIARKVTSPKHLGIQGGSNGGLLMGNMITMRPDLFGAVVCQVPLLDMRRYHKLLAGASWMAEYGNPDDPKEWDFIRNFSPYHNLNKDTKYPRTLFTTSTRDDRVHPGHARKMAARMIEQGHDVLYYENIEGGHGGAADNKQAAFMAALSYTFLWEQLK